MNIPTPIETPKQPLANSLGDLVEHASILHYGDVAAFLKTANRMHEIENQWAAHAVA